MIEQNQLRIGDLDCVVVNQSGLSTPQAAVILCHGFGAPATDLVSLASEFISADESLANAVYIFPGAPLQLDPLFGGRAWWMIDAEEIQRLMEKGETRDLRAASPERLPICRAMIEEVIEYAKSHYSLTADRIVLGGFSQGAMLTTDVALHHSQLLGGLIVWSGVLIDEQNWRKRSQLQPELRVVQSHGTIDPILPIDGARELREMLEETGHDVRYCEFVGPHTIPLDGLQLAAQLIGDVSSGPK